jgi:hypothetical protein
MLRIESRKPQKVLSLFAHPQFNSTIEPEEDPILLPDKRTLVEMRAARIVEYWFRKGLQRPRAYRLSHVTEEAIRQFSEIMSEQKLNYEKIIHAINNFHLAATNPEFKPLNKKPLLSTGILRFIENQYTGYSPLMEYAAMHLPPTLLKERDPQATKKLKRYFAQNKWGGNENDVDLIHHAAFVRATNRVLEHLEKNQHRIHPHMGLSLKNPDLALEGLIKSAQKSGNWNNFKPKWLANNISIENLDLWLCNQNVFRPANQLKTAL